MNELHRIVDNIESVFAGNNYPDEFIAAYDQLECLANHSGRETFLVKRKTDGMLSIAKCYDLAMFPFRPEIDALKKFDIDGLPKYYEQFRNEKMLCIVREYIEGKPLNVYVKEQSLELPEILSVSKKLCDILSYLHTQDPPLIHRDIKPENIIIRTDGSPALIDFDISRAVRADSGTDTVIFGTRGFAPPEQYGFEQTGQKADIYSFGVLLRWMVTGSIRPNHNITIDPRLQKIIDRCTSFSPDDRYADIKDVKNALNAAEKQRFQVSGKILFLLLGCAVLFAVLGFVLGRKTDILSLEPTQASVIKFEEPLIEAAVRAQLGFDEKKKLTESDLNAVKRIYIVGRKVYSSPEDYYSQNIADHVRGSVHSLSDLLLLPNLEEFHMVYQGQVNISALSDMGLLRVIELKHMKLEDVSPLTEIILLRSVVLFDCGLGNVTALEECHWLEGLDVGSNFMNSMDRIGFYPFLKSLCLRSLKFDTLAGIEKLTELRDITLSKAVIGDFSALLELPHLERIFITPDQEPDIRALSLNPGVEIIFTND